MTMTKTAQKERVEWKKMNPTELEKIHSEISKLMAETFKLNAEAGKLNAENRKLSREIFWYPVAVSTGLIAAVAGVTTLLVKHL